MFYAPILRNGFAPRHFDRNLERMLSTAVRSVPQVAFEEDEAQWKLSLDLPGVSRDQLKIDVEGAIVRIETAADAKRPFKAAYELPEKIDAEKTSARLENGVLTLTLGKPERQVKTVNISVA